MRLLLFLVFLVLPAISLSSQCGKGSPPDAANLMFTLIGRVLDVIPGAELAGFAFWSMLDIHSTLATGDNTDLANCIFQEIQREFKKNEFRDIKDKYDDVKNHLGDDKRRQKLKSIDHPSKEEVEKAIGLMNEVANNLMMAKTGQVVESKASKDLYLFIPIYGSLHINLYREILRTGIKARYNYNLDAGDRQFYEENLKKKILYYTKLMFRSWGIARDNLCKARNHEGLRCLKEFGHFKKSIQKWIDKWSQVEPTMATELNAMMDSAKPKASSNVKLRIRLNAFEGKTVRGNTKETTWVDCYYDANCKLTDHTNGYNFHIADSSVDAIEIFYTKGNKKIWFLPESSFDSIEKPQPNPRPGEQFMLQWTGEYDFIAGKTSGSRKIYPLKKIGKYAGIYDGDLVWFGSDSQKLEAYYEVEVEGSESRKIDMRDLNNQNSPAFCC